MLILWGAYPFFFSISPFPIVIALFLSIKLYIGGVPALELPNEDPSVVDLLPAALAVFAWFTNALSSF